MSARRGRGEGSVHFDADRGRWVGVIDLGRDPDTGRRVRRKVTAQSKTAARDRLDELKTELRSTGTVAPRDYTVAALMKDWTDRPPPSLRSPGSLRVHRQHAHHITSRLGSVPVARLRARQVESALQAMADVGMATSTLAGIRSALSRALDRAQRDGLAARNAARLAELPKGSSRPSKSLTRAQADALLGLDLNTWWRAYLMTGIGCGLRAGELLGLRWQDLDLDKGTLSVRQALHEEPGPGNKGSVLRLGELKTSSSRRTIRLPAPVTAALRSHKTYQAGARLRAGFRWQDFGLVFAGPSGKPMRPNGVREVFKNHCKAAGIGTRWHPHELRHTFVSILSEQGATMEQIAAAAGHSSPATTRGVYWHAISDEITTASEAMEDVLTRPPGEQK